MKSSNPLKFVVFPEEEDPDLYGKFEKLAIILADFLGHTYQLVVSNESGNLLANGSWSGCFGLLNRSEVDISTIDFVITPQRNEAAAFLHPVEVGEVTFATRRPTPFSNPNAIFQPFSKLVWLSLAVSMLAMAFAYLYFFKDFYDSLFSVYATASRQSCFFTPRTSSEHIVLGSWTLGMTILSAAYTSLLLSHLTFPNLRGVRTILELRNSIEKGDYKPFIYENYAFGAFLRNSDIESNRVIGNNLIGTPSFQFRESAATNFAFISARDEIKFTAPELVISKDTFFTFLSAFAVRKDFPFKDKLNWAAIRMSEAGIYDKIKKDFMSVPPVYLEEPELTRKLTLLDFKSLFIVVLIGYGASFLILLFELLTFKLKHLKTNL